jgi:DNA-binding beta-propeller fold protein YncE
MARASFSRWWASGESARNATECVNHRGLPRVVDVAAGRTTAAPCWYRVGRTAGPWRREELCMFRTSVCNAPRLRSRWGRLTAPALIGALALAAVPAAAAFAAPAAKAPAPKVPKAIATIKLPHDAGVVAISPRTGDVYADGNAYLASGGQRESTMFILSGRTQKVIGTYTFNGALVQAAVSPVTGDVYVDGGTLGPGSDTSEVLVFSQTNKLIATIPDPLASGMLLQPVVSPKTGDVYIATNDGYPNGTVIVISGRTNRVIATVPVGSNTQGAAVSPLTGDVYVANVGANTSISTVSVISGRTDKVIDTIKDGYGAVETAVDSLTGDVYITNFVGPSRSGTGTGIVLVLNGRTNKLITTIRGNSASDPSMTANPRTGQIYVVTNAGKTLVIGPRTNKIIATYPFRPPIVSPATGDLYVNSYVNNVIKVTVYAP